jgi:hypothetical protein
MYLTFRPVKGNTTTPKRVKWLCIVIDALLLLLMAWTIVNLCYPFWGWIRYSSIWIGFVSYALIILWTIKCLCIRSFMLAKFRPGDQLLSDSPNSLRHLGFLFSVWERPDALALGYYHKCDVVYCLERRLAGLGDRREFSKWLGWLIVLSTDAIPFVLLIAFLCIIFFFGIGAFVFFLMGSALAGQLHTICDRFGAPYLWDDKMFLDGKMCTLKFLGIMMCVLESPEGELFLVLHDVVMFSHYTLRYYK